MKTVFSKLFILLVLSVLLFSCNNQDSYEPAMANFSGQIVGAENQKLFIRRETMNSNHIDTILVEMNGSFTFDIMLEQPAYFTLFVDRNQMIIYMKPGDSLKLNADIQMFDNAKFSGSSTVYNDYLAQFAKNQGAFAMNMQTNFMKPEAEVVKILDSMKVAQTNLLTEFENNNSKVDKIFLNTEQNRIKYFWGLNHVVYPLYYAYYTKIQDFKTSPNYDTFLNEMNLNDSLLLFLPEYRQFISNYLSGKANEYFKKPELMTSNPSFTKYQFELISSHFTDKHIKSYLSYRIMKDHVNYDGIKDYDILYPQFKELCVNTTFQQEIDKDLEVWQSLRKGMPALDFGGVNIKGDSVRLSDFRGKYVYVDVWATWCKPCLQEIPHMLSIEKEFQGKNIVFLGVSVDQDKTEWETMMKDSKLAGVQIYVGLNPGLSEHYRITGIPRFMLFDREGNILEVSADRPSMGVASKLMALEGI